MSGFLNQGWSVWPPVLKASLLGDRVSESRSTKQIVTCQDWEVYIVIRVTYSTKYNRCTMQGLIYFKVPWSKDWDQRKMDGRTNPISLVLLLLDAFYIFPSSKITLIFWLQSLREVMFRNNLFGTLFFRIEESHTHTGSCCFPNLQSVLAMTCGSLWKGISQTETRKMCIWSLKKSKTLKRECNVPQCPQVDGPPTLPILPELVPAYRKGIPFRRRQFVHAVTLSCCFACL